MKSASPSSGSGLQNSRFGRAYSLLAIWSRRIVPCTLLLLMRIIWGWQFFVAGRGKFQNIETPIAFFQKLGIPAPTANAWLVATVEMVGGLMLLAGFGSRAAALALTINMIVAYLTAHRADAMALFANGDVSKFSAAGPFWYLVTSILVLTLGPGMMSVDGLLKRFVFGGREEVQVLPI